VSTTPTLICYDDSPYTARAIEAAASLLTARRAVVLHVAPRMTVAEGVAATSSVVRSYSVEEVNALEAERIAGEGVELARACGFVAEPRGEIAGSTWEGIVNVAEELDTPVIVMGSRGLTGGKSILQRSVSHQVAQHAGRPVLIVPPPYGAG
jgi:nucleotide-binding universal stress UspA family protein